MGSFQIRTSFVSAIAIAACAACSNGSVDIGEDDPATAKSGLAAYAGSWDGYIEAYTFRNDNDDRVRLVIDEEGQGSLRFGERDLYAMPTDQNALWPIADGTDISWSVIGDEPYTGFEYRLVGSIVESERLRSASSTAAVYEPYCPIQNPTYPHVTSTDPIVVEYSRTPVTFVSTEAIQGPEVPPDTPREQLGCITTIYDVAPTTVEELATNSTHTLLFSDCTITYPSDFNPPPSFCSRGVDGTYQLAIPVEQQLDIKLDGRLENDGDSLVGSLAFPGSSLGSGAANVRTVRLTRVN